MNFNFQEKILSVEQFIEIDDSIGIVITNTRDHYFHCGVFYRDEKGKPNIIHLAWHCALLNEEALSYERKINTKIIKSILPIEKQEAVLGLCMDIVLSLNLNNIPYATNYIGNTYFGENGLLHLGDNENGLTCATFVLCVFKSAGCDLIDVGSWEARPDDQEWHDEIINFLVQTKDSYGISDKHINNVRNENGCARFRPEEVAASTTFKILPGPNEQIIEKGALLKEYLLNGANNSTQIQ